METKVDSQGEDAGCVKRARPRAVTVIGWLFIAAGTVGLSYHATEFKPGRFQGELVLICLIRALAIVAGFFVLRGRNWARWLLIVWIGYHVGLSAFHTIGELLMHAVLLLVVAHFLWRPAAKEYFRQ